MFYIVNKKRIFKMSGNSDKRSANAWVWVFLVVAVIWAMVGGNQFVAIHLQDFNVNKITTLLGSLFAIALFFERCTEVIIAIFRNKTAAELKNVLDNLEKMENHAGKAMIVKNAEEELTNYRLETQSISLRVSFIVGIVVSAAGIRILGEMVDIPKDVVDIALSQKNFFHLVDIFITAGVLAGGSDGIHQLMTVFDDNMKYFSKTAMNKTETETAEAKAKQAKADVEIAEAEAKKKAAGA
jgi:hypothetical protein